MLNYQSAVKLVCRVITSQWCFVEVCASTRSCSIRSLSLTTGLVSAFQEDGLRQVLQEMEALYEQNQSDV